VKSLPLSLFQRTGLTLAAALLLFSLFGVLVTNWLILQPLTTRAAEELAALLELSAKVWVELPPWTRKDYARELARHHGLRVGGNDQQLRHTAARRDYLDALEEALGQRFGRPLHVLDDPALPGWYWVELPAAGRTVRLGFRADRLQDRVPAAVLLITAGGTLLILLTSLLLVRRVTLPLSRLSEAVRRLGRGQAFQPVSEQGPRELAELARRINITEQQIRQLLANRTTLLAGVSHDLRTPIARLQLQLELLPGDIDPALVDSIRHDLDEMNALIGRTLQLARGFDRPEPCDSVPDILLQDITADYQRAGHRIQLNRDGDCALQVPGGPLRRALGNLLDNALRYGSASDVTLQLRCTPQSVEVAVIDHGPGIPAGQRDAVLQPFQRLEASRARHTGGSGLGLAIVKQLCDAYDWQLRLEDTPGGGLTVRLTLPGTAA